MSEEGDSGSEEQAEAVVDAVPSVRDALSSTSFAKQAKALNTIANICRQDGGALGILEGDVIPAIINALANTTERELFEMGFQASHVLLSNKPHFDAIVRAFILGGALEVVAEALPNPIHRQGEEYHWVHVAFTASKLADIAYADKILSSKFPENYTIALIAMQKFEEWAYHDLATGALHLIQHAEIKERMLNAGLIDGLIACADQHGRSYNPTLQPLLFKALSDFVKDPKYHPSIMEATSFPAFSDQISATNPLILSLLLDFLENDKSFEGIASKFPHIPFALGFASLQTDPFASRGLAILKKALTLPPNFSPFKANIISKRKAQAYELERAVRKKLPEASTLAKYIPGKADFLKGFKNLLSTEGPHLEATLHSLIAFCAEDDLRYELQGGNIIQEVLSSSLSKTHENLVLQFKVECAKSVADYPLPPVDRVWIFTRLPMTMMLVHLSGRLDETKEVAPLMKGLPSSDLKCALCNNLVGAVRFRCLECLTPTFFCVACEGNTEVFKMHF